MKFDTSSVMTSESSREGDAVFPVRRTLNKDAAKSVEFDSARNKVTSSSLSSLYGKTSTLANYGCYDTIMALELSPHKLIA